MSRTQPNILFFFTDQQRWDTCGCYAPAAARLDVTPNLDRMARDGVRFEHAFTCQPVCGPARSCLQTGLYATETGCFRNDIALPLDATTLAHRLSDAGYEVGYIGKWHLASTGEKANYRTKPVPPERRGGYNDFWLASDVLEFTSHGDGGHLFNADMEKIEFDGYRVDCQTDFVLDYLRTRDRRRPWFLFLSYLEPHHQNDHNRYEGPPGSKERFADYEPPGDLVGTEGDWRESYPDYLGCVNALDRALGRIRHELEGLGMADETALIFTSDHGSHFRTRNKEYKRSCHEASTRVPMVIRGAGFQGGAGRPELVSLIDLPPTVLRAAGAPVPDEMRGRPLQDLIQACGGPWRDDVFVQISESQVGRAVRTDRWKYGVDAAGKNGSRDPAAEQYVEQYLYDLETDPHERNNRVADASLADVRADLRRRLAGYVRRVEGIDVTVDPAA